MIGMSAKQFIQFASFCNIVIKNRKSKRCEINKADYFLPNASFVSYILDIKTFLLIKFLFNEINNSFKTHHGNFWQCPPFWTSKTNPDEPKSRPGTTYCRDQNQLKLAMLQPPDLRV